ncbi:MAG: rRNA maturation RNase YbeY [Candidatus Levybacteria bacterium RIFCSPHIGHO2_02_FULL_42_12]|nr:MAG: rRNA maturation RNase YbeY [Candidatus Levybacteria bacterium RIFCSPHIGHO2_01_FULL_42_15]OGH33896.1 MAG: rRNA maturation RNase YbeY [Candidatus Levybacteria bacterium RIFCSPHIGHO2_02_FULL_42_12]OGH42931.1 MAG: rRNA maturation RNase YbeY [Candidatus Levybacteria bacterium RIFCSPLOWO2_01_FULL_42_15]
MKHPVSVFIFVESRYKLTRKRIRDAIERMLSENSIESPVEVSVAIVGDRKMRQLNKKYRDKTDTTNVLSFSLAEGDSVVQSPEDAQKLRLGDIVISYPQVIKEASEDEVLVDDKIEELVLHGLSHLLGTHHE